MNILVCLAKRISFFFISKGLVKKEEREIYDYCFEIMLSTILNLITLIIVAVMCNIFVETILFIIGFIVVRSTAGGYHSNTHMGCWVTLIISYAVYVLSMNMIANLYIGVMSDIYAIVSVILVMIFSPVQDSNRPFTLSEYYRFKRNSGRVIFVMGSSVLILNRIHNNSKYLYSISAGMLVVSMSLVAGTIKNRFK